MKALYKSPANILFFVHATEAKKMNAVKFANAKKLSNSEYTSGKPHPVTGIKPSALYPAFIVEDEDENLYDFLSEDSSVFLSLSKELSDNYSSVFSSAESESAYEEGFSDGFSSRKAFYIGLCPKEYHKGHQNGLRYAPSKDER